MVNDRRTPVPKSFGTEQNVAALQSLITISGVESGYWCTGTLIFSDARSSDEQTVRRIGNTDVDFDETANINSTELNPWYKNHRPVKCGFTGAVVELSAVLHLMLSHCFRPMRVGSWLLSIAIVI